jgi:hypothetical protein
MIPVDKARAESRFRSDTEGCVFLRDRSAEYREEELPHLYFSEIGGRESDR